MENALISIIVPVYNVQLYIKKCLDSLCNQTYNNIEIIIVNDGSTDESEKIILENFHDNEKIKYYKKENGGLSSARNYGIRISKGKYLAFVDSDDYVNKDFIKDLYYAIEKTKSEIAICNMEYVYSDGTIKKRTPKITKSEVISSQEALKYLFVGEKYKFHAQNKMYLASIFKQNDIFYPEGKIYEDVFTTYKVLGEAKKVALVNKTLYYYLQSRPGSILATKFNDKRFDILEALDEIKKYINVNGMNLEKEFQKLYVINIISLVNYLYPVYRDLNRNNRNGYKDKLLPVSNAKILSKLSRNKKVKKSEIIRIMLIKYNLYLII